MKKDIILTIVFSVLGVLSRTLLHILPNLEFVTALSIASGYFIKNKYLSLVVPLSIMIFSDLLIGNTLIFIFTWTGFLIPVLLGRVIKGKENVLLTKFPKLIKLSLITSLGAILSTIIFFLWTNAGVVLITNMYTKDILGLVLSYINALPFLRVQIIGNIVLTPLVFVVIKLVVEYRGVVLNKLGLVNKFTN